MSTTREGVDRPAAVRAALYRLVARHGFHGASMGAVAKEAGVATGTAYVHYPSKSALVLATYLEVKGALVDAAVAAVDPAAPAETQFQQLWAGAHRHLADDPDRARFLVQVDSSPYADAAQQRATESHGDPLQDPSVRHLVERFVDLPLPVLYDLALGPLVRLVASGADLPRHMEATLVRACWRAISR